MSKDIEGDSSINTGIRYREWTQGISKMEQTKFDEILMKISDANVAFDKFLIENALLFTNGLLAAFLVSTFQLMIGGWFWPFVLTCVCIGLRFVRKKNPPGNGRMNAA